MNDLRGLLRRIYATRQLENPGLPLDFLDARDRCMRGILDGFARALLYCQQIENRYVTPRPAL